MFEFANNSYATPSAPLEADRTIVPRGGDLGELLHRLRRRAWLVILCGVAAVGAALFALPLLKPVYTAQVQILIDPADLRVLDNGVTPTASLADSGVSVAESQARVIASDSVLGRVVARLRLQDDPDFVRPPGQDNGPAGTLKRVLGLAPPADLPQDPALLAVEELRSRVAVRRPERTFVLEVNVKASRGDKAALIANTIAEIYSAQESAARAAFASRASDALSARLSELRAALEAAETRLGKFREDNQLATTNGQLLSDQRLGELNQQLTAASIRAEEARVRADQARRLGGASAGSALPEMLQSAELRVLRQQLADQTRLAAETGNQLGPRHPLVADQRAQLRELERSVAREKARVIESTVKEYDRARMAEASIRGQLDRIRAESRTNNRALIGARERERDVEAQRAIYETFLKRARETNQQERLDTTSMRVISAATPPLGRSWPPSPKVLLPAALLLGLILGAALALVMPGGRTRRATAFVASARPS